MSNDGTAGAASAPDATADDVLRAKRRREAKAVIWATSGVVATAIGAAAIAIPLIADSQRQMTSTGTLVVDPPSAPEGGGLPTSAPIAASEELLALDITEVPTMMPNAAGKDMTFWVPVDAPWTTFPAEAYVGDGGMRGCSDAQLQWLTEHEVPMGDSGGLFDLVNSATDGGALSIRSIRAEGEFVPQDPARIVVKCDGGGEGGGDEYTVLELTLGDPTPATVVRSSVLPTGSLFTRDLAPGEVGQVYLRLNTLDPEMDFEGTITIDVVSGDEESTVTLADGLLWRSAPAVRAGAVLIDATDGGLYCVSLPAAPLFDESGMATRAGVYAKDGIPCSPSELDTWIRGLPVEY